MKTAQIMQRDFKGLQIRQNTKNGFFNLNDLYDVYINNNPGGKKRIDKYLEFSQTREFAETLLEAELEKAENLNTLEKGIMIPTELPSVIETKRGKYGGTWVHPYLFLDFAMWLNPKFKLWAMSVIEDKLIQVRNEAGDLFKEMNQALKASGAVSPSEYSKEAVMINQIVYGSNRGRRNESSIEELTLLNKLQKYNAYMIDKKFPFSIREKSCKQFVIINEITK